MRSFEIPNAPDSELWRSPAAALVGRLAARSGLLLSHFEHRHHQPHPDAWLPAERPDLAGSPEWHGGLLVEHKYAHFRYDHPIGSFHPGHRAKWTAHELCHALVGFAWRPDAAPLFHALAARLSEVLPVALWYFFDEAGLRRCPRHRGPLFDLHCQACEAAAGGLGPVEMNPRWYERGRRFLERELACVARSRRAGRVVGDRFATIDLASDSLAYVAAHGARLASPEMERYVGQFHDAGTGLCDHLDDLEGRVLTFAAALTEEGEAEPLQGSHERWAALDVGWRLLCVVAECEGEVQDELSRLVDRLADDAGSLPEVIAGYEALFDDWVLPEPDELFGVGYPLPAGYGRTFGQIAEGLASTLPQTVAWLGDDFEELATEFLEADPIERTPLARRFARWLRDNGPGAAADLAAYEAAATHAAPPDAEADALGEAGEGLRVADGVEVLSLAHDVTDEEVPKRPTYLAVRRTSGGDTVVAELSGPLEDPDTLDPEERESLRTLGVLTPARYAEISSP